MKIYLANVMGKQKKTIFIGEYFASSKPTVIYTLLGSCVAVCLFDPIKRIGGMNHIFLPGKADFNNFNAPARYGINAMELLINRILNIGGKRRNLVAKVFGGANMLPDISEANGVGRKNIDFTIEFMKNESIDIVSWDMGGLRYEKSIFSIRIPAMFF